MSPSNRVWLCALVAVASCADDDERCSTGECTSAPLAENPWCTFDCPALEELSQGCIGSHTEQDCVACGTTYVRVGGDDKHTLFYDARGSLVAVQIIGEGDDACADAWYGLDLSECAHQGEERRVPCEDQGE